MITTQSFIVNIIKSKVLAPNPQFLHQYRMYVQEKQLKIFWENLPLYRMEALLTIRHERIIQYIREYLQYFLNEKKALAGNQAYFITKQKHQNNHHEGRMNGNHQITQYYVYDCKIFKSPAHQKQLNEILSAFMVVWKHHEESGHQEVEDEDEEQLYEFADVGVFKQSPVIFKCKFSCLLKIFSFFKNAHLDPIFGDTIAIPEEQYYSFLYNWMYCAQSDQIQHMIKHLFRGLIILLQNSMILEFMRELTEEEKEERRYGRPVCVIQKPGYSESYTMIEDGVGDVEWHTLRIKAFNLKYRVDEHQRSYVCYRVKQDEYILNSREKINYDENLKEGDDVILKAFQKMRNEQYFPQQNYQYYA